MKRPTGTLRTCKYGHEFYKSSDCPTCPECEKAKAPKNGFLSALPAPARRGLQNAGLTTLPKLATRTENEILNLHGIGKTSIPILKEELKKAGLAFRE